MIKIKKALLAQMERHCLRGFPNEACGILAGKAGVVEKAYEMMNADKSAATFFMDAAEQLNAMKDMRSLGLEMIGIYHSHVASRAYPSAHDVEMAFYPSVSYVIISLMNKEDPDTKSFSIIDKKITEEKVDVT